MTKTTKTLSLSEQLCALPDFAVLSNHEKRVLRRLAMNADELVEARTKFVAEIGYTMVKLSELVQRATVTEKNEPEFGKLREQILWGSDKAESRWRDATHWNEGYAAEVDRCRKTLTDQALLAWDMDLSTEGTAVIKWLLARV